jgi:lipopolysaccharide export system protein LptA
VSGDFDPPKAEAQKTNKKRHLELKSDDLEVHSGNGSLDRIVATGSVEITQGVRKGRGTFLTYDVATGTTLLTGTSASPAMVNVEGKDSQGCSIRMEADGSGEIRSCENGSVITSIPVKKN